MGQRAAPTSLVLFCMTREGARCPKSRNRSDPSLGCGRLQPARGRRRRSYSGATARAAQRSDRSHNLRASRTGRQAYRRRQRDRVLQCRCRRALRRDGDYLRVLFDGFRPHQRGLRLTVRPHLECRRPYLRVLFERSRSLRTRIRKPERPARLLGPPRLEFT